MGDLNVVEPNGLVWESYPQFLDGYWPEIGVWGAGERTRASKPTGRIVADWHISNGPWEPYGDERLLRYTPAHSGRLRLIAVDDSPSDLVNGQIDFYPSSASHFHANSQDVLVIRKNAHSHAFIDTLETIANDEQAYVEDVVVVEKGSHNQQLVKVVTAEGEDWIYLSGQWGERPDGDQPVAGIVTDADILVWRVVDNTVTRFYLAGGSYAMTSHGSWDFGSAGNHYIDDGI